MHSWLFIAGAVVVALVVARFVLGTVGRLVAVVVVIGVLVITVGSAAGGISGLRKRADCVQRYPQLGSALVHEIEHGCTVRPAPTPQVLAAALRRQGIGARAVTGAQVGGLHLSGGLTVPAGVTAAVVPTRGQRFVVLYTRNHRTAEQVKREIASRLHIGGIVVPTGDSHLGVDGSVVYLDATSATDTPVTDAVTGL